MHIELLIYKKIYNINLMQSYYAIISNLYDIKYYLQKINIDMPEYFYYIDDEEMLYTILYDIKTFGFISDNYLQKVWLERFKKLNSL